ncbi:MAG TPA: hypothetical protein VFF04_00965 [Candidatus Babeliales bacterium]|nr:hypothetical protein [Candidatus Babeliales bacterium]
MATLIYFKLQEVNNPPANPNEPSPYTVMEKLAEKAGYKDAVAIMKELNRTANTTDYVSTYNKLLYVLPAGQAQMWGIILNLPYLSNEGIAQINAPTITQPVSRVAAKPSRPAKEIRPREIPAVETTQAEEGIPAAPPMEAPEAPAEIPAAPEMEIPAAPAMAIPEAPAMEGVPAAPEGPVSIPGLAPSQPLRIQKGKGSAKVPAKTTGGGAPTAEALKSGAKGLKKTGGPGVKPAGETAKASTGGGMVSAEQLKAGAKGLKKTSGPVKQEKKQLSPLEQALQARMNQQRAGVTGGEETAQPTGTAESWETE